MTNEIGIDIIETVRIKGVLDRHDDRFLRRVYTEWERAYCRHNYIPAERAVALSDITTPDAQAYVRHRLQRLGVDRALERAGAREGDTVHIGGMAFEYQAESNR